MMIKLVECHDLQWQHWDSGDLVARNGDLFSEVVQLYDGNENKQSKTNRCNWFDIKLFANSVFSPNRHLGVIRFINYFIDIATSLTIRLKNLWKSVPNTEPKNILAETRINFFILSITLWNYPCKTWGHCIGYWIRSLKCLTLQILWPHLILVKLRKIYMCLRLSKACCKGYVVFWCYSRCHP